MLNAAQRYIAIDPRSGSGVLKIPVARLWVDDGQVWGFNVDLTCTTENSSLDFISMGSAFYAPFNTIGLALQSVKLKLQDGRKVEVPLEGMGTVMSDGYLVDLAPNPTGHDVVVHHKNGLAEVFDVSYGAKPAEPTPWRDNFALLTRYIAPSGRCLKFTWDYLDEIPRVVGIDDNGGRVVTAVWEKRTKDAKARDLKSLSIFPGSDEEINYSFAYKDSVLTVEAKGAGILGVVRYKIKDDKGQLQSLDVELVPDTPEQAENISRRSESLVYKDGKISQYSLDVGGGVDKRTEDYVYADSKTSISIKQGKQVLSREHGFKDGLRVSESTQVNGVTRVTEQNLSLDEGRGRVVVKTTCKHGDNVVQTAELEYDNGGNLVASVEGDRVTEYTYYNNYQAYFVKEKEIPVKDTSWFGLMFSYLDVGAVGLGALAFGSSGFTWGSRMETDVSMEVSANDYAKDALNLPLHVKYPGDSRGFATHMESMLVYRKDGDNKYPLSLTYFGYEKFVPAKVKLHDADYVIREHVAFPSVKLTVLQPAYEVADISAEQLKVAKSAARNFLSSLEKQRSSAADDKARKEVQKLIDGLNSSLIAQSKANATGFKLGPWSDGMQVEVLAYHSDSAKPGFGEVKSTTFYLLDSEAKEVEASRVVTKFDYSLDAKDKRKLTIKSTVSTSDKLSVSTSNTRSVLSGRVYENIDGEGVKTVHSYKDGLTEAVKVTQGTLIVDEVTYSVTSLSNKLFQFESYSSRAGEHSRVIRDSLGREVEHSLSSDGTTWLKMSESEYDASGRAQSLTEYDYDAVGGKSSTRVTSWKYEKNKCTATLVLKDAADKQTDSRIQVLEQATDGETLTFNTFKVKRSYDHAKRTLTEDFNGEFKVRQAFSAGGLLQSIKYLTVGKDTKEVEQDSLAFGYNSAGLVASLTPKVSGASTYTYDIFGRLLTAVTDATEVRNVYSNACTSEVALEGFAKDSSSELELGSQTVDGLGRTASQTVNSIKTDFVYAGCSQWGKSSGSSKGSGTLAGYKSGFDSSSLSYSESITKGKSSSLSKAVYSRRGSVLSFEGLSGGNTSYGYDALGRLIKSSNESCQATFEYGDNSLLKKETIKAMAANLVMTVTYTYNSMGEETGRKFECPGFDTLECVRELLGDGRLSKNTLKINAKESRSDSYTYDSCNRLKSWSCTGEGVRNHEGKCYVSEEFTYDVLGDVLTRVNQSYTAASRPQKLDNSTSSYKFDPKKPGAITASGSATMVQDSQGRLTKRVSRNITYYDNGQVATYSATPDGKGGDYTFSYDDLGRVRGGSVGNYSDAYHYRGSRIYALVQTDSDKKYGFHARQLVLQNDSPSCWMQDILTTLDRTDTTSSTFELRDAAGSVFASLDLDKKAIKYFTYSPFGYRNPDPASVTWRGFKGEPLNMLSLYYLGSYRLYDPQLHRFQTPDSRSPFGVGGVSRYAYCGSDPVNNNDPSGHQLVAQYSRLNASPWMHSDAFRIVTAVIGVISAPFTGGSSLAFTIASTGLALVSLGFEIASIILKDSDPKLAQIMGGLGMAFSFMSIGVGHVGTEMAQLARSTRVGAASRLANKGDDAASLINEAISTKVERYNPNIYGPDRVVLGEVEGTAFELYTAGPQSERLVISAHGEPVAGLSFGGPNNPIPEFFSTNVSEKVGFYADQGFKVHMKGHSYYDVLSGAYVPGNYYAPQKVPNYLLSEFTTAEHLQEMPGLAKIPNFNASSTFGQVAHDLNVDYLRPLQPVTTEQIFSALERAGYRYKVVDGLHCRGSISPGTSPSLIQGGLHSVFKGLDWWKGVRMVP